MLAFYILAGLVVLQSALSLRGGVRYFRFFRRELSAPRSLYMPLASVFVPCRGLDQGLRWNLSALFRQHYPAYELVFVSDRADDAGLEVAREVAREFEGESVARPRYVVAGRATDSGQKVHNLRAAVAEADASSEVFVFVDTDARPRADWLRSLVAPLGDGATGAATGYRWFLPLSGGFASQLRSVWNASIASALGGNVRGNFCWGGSTAVRRETFERLNVAGRWRGAVSDDYALTSALRAERLPIRFVPACLTASLEDSTLGEMLEFTTRQLKITRVYAPRLWAFVLVSNLLFVAAFFGGLALAAARAALGLSFVWPLALVSVIFLLGMWKSFFRLRAVALALEEHHARLAAGVWPHLLLWPLTAAVFLYNALAAGLSRRIVWRGIAYELKSPTETEIIPNAECGVRNAD
ncbi:MAG TPA: glycosyltransferase family 2 protein [Pyrinomonadaceae bacterium]|jgi:cellulose synthase/poly-beta-1,6-N-acetylglucosamine synthase-like glycosyltransferase